MFISFITAETSTSHHKYLAETYSQDEKAGNEDSFKKE
jgi:hypothetical protein